MEQTDAAGTANPDLLSLLKSHFGFESFRPGQQQVIEALCRRNAALAVFPTGAGKSLCYELPALMSEGITLVVSPLIALMKNQIDYLRRLGIAASRLDSSLTDEEAKVANEQLRLGLLKLLYVAPERFNNERFLETIRTQRISLFAIDEAHCISEWGHNFRPDYLKLAGIVKQLQAEKVLALTATATPTVVDAICERFGIPKECAIVTGFYRHNLSLLTTPVPPQDRDALLLKRLDERPSGTTIVYVTLQKTAERIAALLTGAGYCAQAYHAGMDADERTFVQEWWMSSQTNIVVATIAFGMGIDKADVRYVYHYNLPKGLESYSQEIGRAGRDGEPSTVELFACADDIPTLENFAFGDTPSKDSLWGLVDHIMTHPDEFDISLYDLSVRFDIRQQVLRTALTYMELLGILRQRTPFYSVYKIQPLQSIADIIQRFHSDRTDLVTNIFSQAKVGRTWYTLDLPAVIANLGEERSTLVRTIEHMKQQGWIELQVTGVRHQYAILRRPQDIKEIVDALIERFEVREQQDITRIAQVTELVLKDGCQTNALVRHFGEERAEPCGHCTWCTTGTAQKLPEPLPLPPMPAGLDIGQLQALRAEFRQALGSARQVARFLCGLSSPALTRFRLGGNSMFGVFADRRFSEVLAWCEEADNDPDLMEQPPPAPVQETDGAVQLA